MIAVAAYHAWLFADPALNLACGVVLGMCLNHYMKK